MSLKYITPVFDVHQFNLAYLEGVREFLIAPAKLSRFGKLELREASDFALSIKEKNDVTVVLEWDALYCQNKFSQLINELKSFNFEVFDEIFRLDVGCLGQ